MAKSTVFRIKCRWIDGDGFTAQQRKNSISELERAGKVTPKQRVFMDPSSLMLVFDQMVNISYPLSSRRRAVEEDASEAYTIYYKWI